MTNTSDIRMAYHSSKSGAKRRGLEWGFDYDNWVAWWEANLGGMWYFLRGEYVMARKEPDKGFVPDNVVCVTREAAQKMWAANSTGRWGVKLTPEQVLVIYHAKGGYEEIARCYGMGAANVSRIKNKMTWRNVTVNEPPAPKRKRGRRAKC